MKACWWIAVAVTLVACGKDDKRGLPPATGAGAPPLPTLPPLAAAAPPGPPSSLLASVRRSTGSLLPHAEVAVVSRARGVVTALDVEIGSQVKKGQVVFRVDDREAGLHQAQAQTELAVAEQSQHSIEVEYRRTMGLFDQQAASAQQRDQVTAQLDAAKLAVAQAHNSVAVAGKAVSDTVGRAPIDGIVVTRAVSLGDYVSDAPPTPVVTLQDQATLDLKFRLPEQALATVRRGDALTISLPALGVSRKATIAIVAPSVDPRTRTVELTAWLDNRDGALRPGLMADVELSNAVADRGAQP
jgi:membrane fusion protein (multidrug efflux system)